MTATQSRPQTSVSNPQAAPVKLEGVTKRFGKTTAVQSANLEVQPGTLVTLLGPSGCGKTTILRMIAGLETITEGKLSIDHEDVTQLSAAQRDVTMVFQSYALFPHLSVLENVAYGLRVARRPDAAEAAEEALKLVGLGGYGSRAPSQLSGGQQQRVALARALVMKPKVLLFDEPLSNLDAKLRRQMRNEIRAIQQQLGITAVYVTHDQAEALAISDVVVVMSAGKIEQIGTPEDLYRRPANAFVADFVGEANLLQGTYDGQKLGFGNVFLPYTQPGAPTGDVRVLVRPESISFSERGLAGRITSGAYLGAMTEYTIETSAGDVLIAPPSEATILPNGSDIHLDFRSNGLYILPA
ncbi:ABC transporter ATP-binding protein [Deinococcus marmoris]|uniref:Putrescine transport ATP-binding protein PotA n=1 Tax=Deinococcus marmoris TaxID=249408 RepID=A0A1U7P167_9DEIO|nr:ABC transporter ATP-binding protein [Deinococcus marmoris]OLV18913.1 Putrescine transport ATP-binding protein PotA [Deinococcus marmoris]